jgi:oxygen-independent coproporphyrinogen-3 oxidase
MNEARRIPIEALYVHVPFCAQKCSYCAFYSEASNGERINAYVRALIRELEIVAEDLKPRTIFFGGGTPSLLNLHQWERILESMRQLNLSDAIEWTVECNPATISLDKARLLRSAGVTRISMGVQSLDPFLLGKLGRIHSREMVFKSFEILRRAGFDNLNLDLMFAIPGQNLEVWSETLTEAIAMGSEHLSCYEVIYEEDTPLYEQLKSGKFAVDEELACAMYDELLERAASAGLRQYEVANFARESVAGFAFDKEDSAFQAGAKQHEPGREDHAKLSSASAPPAFACQHNLNYWRGGSFLGLGPSAASYVNRVRTKNWSNTDIYCRGLDAGRRAVESIDELAPLARAGETAAFGLRMVAGWDFEQFRQTTGYDLQKEWPAEIEQLIDQGWGQKSGDRFRLTAQGLRFADAAGALFLR